VQNSGRENFGKLVILQSFSEENFDECSTPVSLAGEKLESELSFIKQKLI